MILSAIKNSHGSWEGDNISTLTRVWKKLVPTLMDDFAEVQDLSGGGNCRCGGNSKRTRIRSGVWRWDGSAASHDETWRMRSCFLWMSKEGGFLRWNLLLVKILWRCLKWQEDLDYSVNLVDKTTEGLERTDHSFERCSTVDKMLSHNVATAEKLFMKGRGQSIQWTSLLS